MTGLGREVRDGRLAAAAFGSVLLFKLLIAVVGYRRLTWLFPSGGTLPSDALARRFTRAVLVASRRLGGASCLVEACAVRALLGLKGHAVTMRIGVRDAGGGVLAAHAWVMAGEQVILGTEANDFDHFRPIADYR